ncbi:MAG: hypothetical protein IKO93_13220 [Lentisphaeria bacterium]|nr:hypothetical protein [Lentisphaeria bacterium]
MHTCFFAGWIPSLFGILSQKRPFLVNDWCYANVADTEIQYMAYRISTMGDDSFLKLEIRHADTDSRETYLSSSVSNKIVASCRIILHPNRGLMFCKLKYMAQANYNIDDLLVTTIYSLIRDYYHQHIYHDAKADRCLQVVSFQGNDFYSLKGDLKLSQTAKQVISQLTENYFLRFDEMNENIHQIEKILFHIKSTPYEPKNNDAATSFRSYIQYGTQDQNQKRFLCRVQDFRGECNFAKALLLSNSDLIETKFLLKRIDNISSACSYSYETGIWWRNDIINRKLLWLTILMLILTFVSFFK